ncbi:MAG: S-methyl-5-thioribose-1-phosphate isomerase [Deltaproteobacteria bacterium]|nr:S-methyl-5-thioribose-1-phosphate isomerase [Deltaproteobacteria bacterium]
MTRQKSPASRLNEDLSPLHWNDEAKAKLQLLDQRCLPNEERWLSYRDDAAVAEAIKTMVVRGAPAIGCAAAFALVLGAEGYPDDAQGFRHAFAASFERLAASRPTAVNLFWALDRQQKVMEHALASGADPRRALRDEALAIWREDIESCRQMGRHGAKLLGKDANVLTHCNAGALATGGYGTALGVIRAAHEAGQGVHVYADETRPYLQGARLTAWELQVSGIDVTLICDNMSGALMRQGAINTCIVGADRIAKNGDVANKIGTYMVAVLAARHGIPFYVAAPLSTIDLETADGDAIPIEERSAREVTHVGKERIAPEGVAVRHIAFDVTPAELVTAIITEAGVAEPPYEHSLPGLFSS